MRKCENCTYRRICGFGRPTEGDCASRTPPKKTGALRRFWHKLKLFLRKGDCGNCFRCIGAEMCYYDYFNK